LPVLAALLVALALAGCGGGDDSTTTTTGAAPGGDTTRQQPQDLSPRAQRLLEQARRKAEQQGGGEAKDGSGNAQPAEVPFEEPTGPAPTTSGSLPNEGSKKPAPGVPLAKGGDNSIQTFGVEAPSADRVEAARVFQAYLDARLAGDWALACSYLSSSMKSQLVQLAGRGDGSADCTEAMRALTQGVSKEALRNAADIRVLSMRVEGGQAFLLYRDGGGSCAPFKVADSLCRRHYELVTSGQWTSSIDRSSWGSSRLGGSGRGPAWRSSGGGGVSARRRWSSISPLDAPPCSTPAAVAPSAPNSLLSHASPRRS
jgi:hypothetical protein